jgi:hypothetical protein
MNNEFEVALWVAQHPRILNLALGIHNAKSTPTTPVNETPQALIPLYPTNTMPLEVDQVT